jgi:hypothetical protein
MILQKKQIYLNKVLSKHYKTLRYTLFDKTQNIPALKTTAIAGAQSIGISILTIDTISHKDFPNIIDVTVLNGLRKTKKAVIIYEGQTTIPTTFTRSISKFAQKQPLGTPQKPKDTGNVLLLSNPHALNHSGTLPSIDRMLGAGVRMHNYKLYFNSLLSLQHLDVLRRKQKIKLKNLDRLAASLILPKRTLESKTKDIVVQGQGALKRKEVRLSKMELSSIIAQVLHKTQHPLSKQELQGESVFTIKKLFNVLGALVEINSKIYFISDKELKQCNLAGGLKHSTFNSSTFHNYTSTKLKSLIYSKMTRDKEILLRTKNIEPNIIFFNFLNTAVHTYAIHNIKRIFSKLVNILSRLV